MKFYMFTNAEWKLIWMDMMEDGDNSVRWQWRTVID